MKTSQASSDDDTPRWSAQDVDATFDGTEHDWDDSSGWDMPETAPPSTSRRSGSSRNVTTPATQAASAPALNIPITPEIQFEHCGLSLHLTLTPVAAGNWSVVGMVQGPGRTWHLSGFLTREQLVVVRLTLDPRRTAYGTASAAEPFIERLVSVPDTTDTHLALARGSALRLLERWAPAPRSAEDWLR